MKGPIRWLQERAERDFARWAKNHIMDYYWYLRRDYPEAGAALRYASRVLDAVLAPDDPEACPSPGTVREEMRERFPESAVSGDGTAEIACQVTIPEVESLAEWVEEHIVIDRVEPDSSREGDKVTVNLIAHGHIDGVSGSEFSLPLDADESEMVAVPVISVNSHQTLDSNSADD